MRTGWLLLCSAMLVLAATPAHAIEADTFGACFASWVETFAEGNDRVVGVCVEATAAECDEIRDAQPTFSVEFYAETLCADVPLKEGYEWEGACRFYDDIGERDICGLVTVEMDDNPPWLDGELFCVEGLDGEFGGVCRVPAVPDNGLLFLAILLVAAGALVTLRQRGLASR